VEKETEKTLSEIEEKEENLETDTEVIDHVVDGHHLGGVKEIDLTKEMKTSFLSYAMSVIVARALPDVRDGMKPVHRRILFAMDELGVGSDKPYKKSARIVGDVMGKYHPHGDSAIYDSMVRMAQNFSYRYPLVDGQGNFGSIDGDGAAAMRYTEARMSKIAMELLRDLGKNTVDFQDNYDGSEKEPVVLPCRFPNILVNGATGIAVGMATNIPPHNLSEVIDGILALIKNPDISIEGLMNHIKGPDFPTGGCIMGLSQVRKAYMTGNGTITIRAKCEIKELENGKKEIIITEIPYQVNKTKLIERIAFIANEKIVEGITGLQDESTRKGMRIVVELRRDTNPNVVLNNLYKHTQLQSTFGVNILALDKGQPKVLNLKEVLECYLEHQIEVITRRTQYDLEKAEARAHIVEGLLTALGNIDAVIQLIKRSKTTEDAVKGLIETFNLTEIQAKAILDMKLQRLTGLEIDKLKEELASLKREISEYKEILKNQGKKLEIIIGELTEMKEKFGDARNSDRIDNPYYKSGKEIIKIDHHIRVEDFGTINYVDEDMPATACIITELYEENRDILQMNQKAAQALYVGIATDTGRFRYRGVSAKVLRLSAILLDYDLDLEKIYANLYLKDIASLKLQGDVFRKFKSTPNGVLYVYVTNKMQKKYNISPEDAAALVNSLDSVKDSLIWIIFVEQKDKTIRVRIRSRFVAIDKLANKYRGGGHANASGAVVYNGREIKQLVKDADEVLEKFKASEEGWL
jgi:DNA gyrase/topoisomerase IV subunit A